MVNQAIHSLRTLKRSSITFIFFDLFFFYSLFLYIYVQLIVTWQSVFSKKDRLFPETITMFANCYIVIFNVFPFVSMAIFKPTAEIELLF